MRKMNLFTSVVLCTGLLVANEAAWSQTKKVTAKTAPSAKKVTVVTPAPKKPAATKNTSVKKKTEDVQDFSPAILGMPDLGVPGGPIREVIENFYGNFNLPTAIPHSELLEMTTTKDWKSCLSKDVCRGRDIAAGVFAGFARAIPDMKHTIQFMEFAGKDNKYVVVRGELTGTPIGSFYGVPHTGRSFKIMTLDIHELRNGKIAQTYHLEDWTSAIGQLRSR